MTAAPGDEGAPRHRRPEYDRGEPRAVCKRTAIKKSQSVRECERVEASAPVERAPTDPSESVRESDGGEAETTVEHRVGETSKCDRECERGERKLRRVCYVCGTYRCQSWGRVMWELGVLIGTLLGV